MNKSIKLLSFFLLFSASSIAQDFQGKAVYKTSSKMDLQLDGQGLDPEMQKKVQAMLLKQSQKEYTLAFDSYHSLFTLNESLGASPQQGGMMMISVSMDGSTGSVYKNTKEKRYASTRDLFGKPFLVKGDLEAVDWELTNETKQIGIYTCYKATYEREQESFQSITINNEEENKTETTTKTITVEAWYTPDIPVAHGPQMYWGLPGLVMEVKDGNSTVICSGVTLNPTDKVEIKEPKSGKVISESDYEVVMEEKMAEMEKMDRGGKQKGGGHRIKMTVGG